MRRVLAVAAVAALGAQAAGCGARCAEIAARKRAVTERTEVAAGPHAQVVVPLARANQLIATLIRDPPIRAPIELPDLRPLPRPAVQLSALVRGVELRAAPANRLRFAIELEIADAGESIAGDRVEVDVRDRLVEAADASALLELALWIKQLIQGSVDSSYRAAAHTRLAIGSRKLDARVLGATTAGDDLAFTLALVAAP